MSASSTKSSERTRSSTVSRYLIGITLGTCLTFIVFFGYTTLFGSDQSRGTLPVSLSESSSPAAENTTVGSVFRDSDFGSDLREITQHSSDFFRSVALYDLLYTLNQEELTDLSNRSSSIEHPDRRRATQAAIGQRMASIDPNKALEVAMGSPIADRIGLLTGVYQEWSVSDLDDAIASVQPLDKATTHLALQTILQTRSDLSDNRLLEIAAKIGREEFAIGLITAQTTALHVDKPAKAWDVHMADGLDNAYQMRELREIAQAWFERDGFAILPRLFSTLQDSSNFNVRNQLILSVVENDPKKAFDYVNSLPIERNANLLSAVIRIWARTEPKVAVEAVSEIKPSSASKLLLSDVLYTWARHDPSGLLASLDQFDSELQLTAAERAIEEIGSQDPEQAAKIVDELKSRVSSTASIEAALMDEWSKSNPRRSIEWILEDSQRGGIQRRNLIGMSLRGLSREDPQLAFQIGLLQPLVSKHDTGLEADVISEVSTFDIETAISLLPSVRQESKFLSHLSVGLALVEQRNPFRSLELAEKLPESQRDFYYQQIGDQWARTNPTHLFEALDQLESKELQSIVAKSLIRNNRRNPVLTKSQLDRAESLLDTKPIKVVGGRGQER
ncbi:MAG: hypothetical protein OXG24_11910 [Gammaproteobacteria bacterium]|nr:hypothetical protein [Gammaproteobacteria bacterium]